MNLVTHPASAQWLDPKVTGNPCHIGALADVPARTMAFYLQELPPHTAGDLQRHHHESVHIVTAGAGFSEIGEATVRWSEGDLVYTPPWVWHRHYNDGGDPVRMVLVENSRLLEALGVGERQSAGEIPFRDLRNAVAGAGHAPLAS